MVASCPDRRLLRSIAGMYCLLATPFLIYVCLTGERLWGRLVANDLEPNNWGLMGFTVCLAALARKLGPIAVVGFLAGAVTILEASSREHLVALAVVLLVIAALRLGTMSRAQIVVGLAGLGVALALTAVLLDPFLLDTVDFVAYNVFQLDSPTRGVDSGFTGRTELWAATVDLWLKSPLLGVGFRQHEQFLPYMAPAHNSYLAMMADTGLLGLFVYLALLVGSLIASFGIADQRTRRFVLTMIVGYIVIGFFDRRTINGGNPFSLFFLLCCSMALVDQSLRKASSASLTARIEAREAAMASDTLQPQGYSR
jgi:O-antigen ligase